MSDADGVFFVNGLIFILLLLSALYLAKPPASGKN